MRRDPRVAVTVLDLGDWYRAVTVLGKVVELRDDEGLSTSTGSRSATAGRRTGTGSATGSRL